MENTNQNEIISLKKRKVSRKIIKWIIILFFLVCFVGLIFTIGFVSGKVTSGKINYKFDASVYEETPLPQLFDNKLVKQVWNLISTEYVDKDKIKQDDLLYGALKGFVSGLGDPHTDFLDPKEATAFDEALSGEFQGIGAEISLKDGVPTVVAPLPDTPASSAGLKPGDKIFAIDGKDTNGLSLEEAVALIRGPKGTKVKLLIVRGEEDPFEVEIARDNIVIKSVKWEFRQDGLAYVNIRSFNEDTEGLFADFVKEVKANKPKGIILDLRNDPGGLLTAANTIAGEWIENQLIVSEKFGNGESTDHNAPSGAPLKSYPTVVLINEGSASGSEIVAGALQDYSIAKLVGKKSFGKGSVQTLHRLPDGSYLKVTIAKWFTPKGRSIDKEGIKPDIEVNYTKDDVTAKKDPQLNKAIELLLKK